MEQGTLKGAWLQVSGRAPVRFDTQGAADAALKATVEKAEAAGWVVTFGNLGRKIVVLEKDGVSRRVFTERCDAAGVKVGGAGFKGARMSEGRKDELLAGTYVTP